MERNKNKLYIMTRVTFNTNELKPPRHNSARVPVHTVQELTFTVTRARRGFIKEVIDLVLVGSTVHS